MQKRGRVTLADLERYIAKQKQGYEEFYGQKKPKKEPIIKEEGEEEEDIFNIEDGPAIREKETIEQVKRIMNDTHMAQPEKETEVIKLIGPPPYSNEDMEKYNLPLGFVTRKKMNTQSAEYKYENAHPGYSKFKVHMVDTLGREYQIPSESEKYEYSLINTNHRILFVKIPIDVKRKGVTPPLIKEKVNAFERDLKYQVEFEVTAVFFRARRATGYIRIKPIKYVTGTEVDLKNPFNETL